MSHIFIVSLGESNSGGAAANAGATAGELAAHSGVKMLIVTKTSGDPSSQYFASLDIGTNNNLSHNGGLDSTTHGWELQLANDQESGEWGTDTLYYCQTGQGGSKTVDWANGSSYWTEAVRRINLAKTYATDNGLTPVWLFWITLGVNDSIAGTSVATFKTEYLSLINRIKAECSGASIVMTSLPGSRSTYDAKIRELADSETDVTFADVTGCTNDNVHFDYAGYKTLSTRMTQISQQMMGTRAGQIWSNFTSNCGPYGSTLGWAAGGNGGANTKTAFHFSDGQYLAFRTDSASASIVIYLQTFKDTDHSYPLGNAYIQGIFHDGFSVYRIQSGTVTNIGTIISGGRLRFLRSGTDLVIQKDNNNESWSTLATVSGVMSGVTDTYFNAVNVSVGATDTLFLTTPVGAFDVGANTTFLVGESYSFSWGTSRYGSTVDIVVSLDGGSTFPVTVASNIDNDGSYTYVPTDEEMSATAVIKLRDHNSPGVFEVSDEVIIATTTAGGGNVNSDFVHQLQGYALSAGLEIIG